MINVSFATQLLRDGTEYRTYTNEDGTTVVYDSFFSGTNFVFCRVYNLNIAKFKKGTVLFFVGELTFDQKGRPVVNVRRFRTIRNEHASKAKDETTTTEEETKTEEELPF